MMRVVFSHFSGTCRLAVALGAVCVLMGMPQAAFAAPQGLVVSPLGDDSADAAQTRPSPGGMVPFFAGEDKNGQTQPQTQSQTQPQDGITAGDLGTTASGGTPVRLSDEPPSYKDGIVMAYLVELLRKQNKPCPSGVRLPVPPSLLFSEPLCRVAESVGKGGDFPSAFEAQGLHAASWRMFSAADQSAQKVVTGLREAHCEALLEPHTHIGAWHSPAGWRIVLATLTDKPPVVPQADQAAVPESAVPAPAAPDRPSPEQATPPPAPSSVPVVDVPRVTRPDAAPTAPRPDLPSLADMRPATAPVPAVAETRPLGQDAQALFQLMNDLRAKGGECSGKPLRPTSALSIHPDLQAAAEKEVAAAATRGSFGAVLDSYSDKGGQGGDSGAVFRLTATDRSSATLVRDVWLVSPSRCEALLSPLYRDAGVAHANGFWLVLLGRAGK